MTISITGEQRDALYGQLLERLNGIGDIPLAIEARNFGVAERIGYEFVDELRILLDDLGLGESARDEPVELHSPPEVLQRVLPRLRSSAESYAASLDPDWREAEAMRGRARLVGEVCTAVLGALEETGAVTEGRAAGEAPRMSSEPPISPRR